MRKRVIKKDGYYYPQYKFLFWWCFYTEYDEYKAYQDKNEAIDFLHQKNNKFTIVYEEK